MDVVEQVEGIAEGGVDDKGQKKPSLSFQDIAGNVLYIIKGIELNQPRLLHRAIRQNVSIRHHIDRDMLNQLIERYLPTDHVLRESIASYINLLPVSQSSAEKKEAESMEIDETATPSVLSVLPEVEVYLFTLVITTLLRHKLLSEAAEASQTLVDRLRTFNRRSLDIFSAKAFFYYVYAHELTQQFLKIRANLLLCYRTACVRHDEMSQAVLLNSLLRMYISSNLVEQAHVLSLRAPFPEHASNNQYCRYLYYLGRIQAVQLDYSEAYQRLTMASRKAPQSAAGFVKEVTKLTVLVQLLMGDIPERSVFNLPELKTCLAPYLALTQAVRGGDVVAFEQVLATHGEQFRQDRNVTLVQRLGHNVLKTGLRKISLSYSRISLQEVAKKLHLGDASAGEYVVAKAIRDGVIEAKIDHEHGWMTCQEVTDLYSTEEPQKAFHKRTAFCLDVHNEAVKSMRYPPDASYSAQKNPLVGGAGADKGGDGKGNEEKSIEDLIKEMEDDFDE
eukprot:gene34416-41656_t